MGGRKRKGRTRRTWTLDQLKMNTIPGPGGCQLWTGRTDAYGYGVVWHQGREWKAHRLAWHLTHGEIPPGMFVLHGCDQPACLRVDSPEDVDHLHLGDHRLNMAEARERGRLGTGPSPYCRRGHVRLGPGADQRRTNYGQLVCRACARQRARQRRAAARQKLRAG